MGREVRGARGRNDSERTCRSPVRTGNLADRGGEHNRNRDMLSQRRPAVNNSLLLIWTSTPIMQEPSFATSTDREAEQQNTRFS